MDSIREHRTVYACAAAVGLIVVSLMLYTAFFSGERISAGGEEPPIAKPSPTSTGTPSHSVGEGPQSPVTHVPANPEWLPGDKESAKEMAVNAMRDFARPNVEESQWSNDFASWLTPKATIAYSCVDPANIPVAEVTGPAALEIVETNGFGAMATVPTDIGPYKVQLLRQGQGKPWKVNRLYPPKTANQRGT